MFLDGISLPQEPCTIPHLPYHDSEGTGPFQSLAQMKVGQRHCVPFSFSPLGPRGRGQIQKARPQLMPGFFVVRLIHDSWWLSHWGTGFLVKSLVQSSLLTMGSMIVSANEFGSFCSSGFDSEGKGSSSSGIPLPLWKSRGLKKPLSVF